MQNLNETIKDYSNKHLNKKNIIIHYFAIPMYQIAIFLFLSLINKYLSYILILFLIIFYLSKNLKLGIFVSIFTGLSFLISQLLINALSINILLIIVLLLFFSSLIMQKNGHKNEKNQVKYSNKIDPFTRLLTREQFYWSPFFLISRLKK